MLLGDRVVNLEELFTLRRLELAIVEILIGPHVSEGALLESV